MRAIAIVFLLPALVAMGMENPTEKAVLGGGCFWCVEAVYESLPGVVSVSSGYAAGAKPYPTYDEVCSGNSGHAEVVEITFDPSILSYEKILEVFWSAHDPTTLNLQGADRGTQYRSIIVARNPGQKAAAEQSKAAAQPRFRDPIVTEIIDPVPFYPAENYHQEFAARNPDHPYVRAVIAPKLKKLQSP
jgi:peptide-methionine (S)-S-oxide reductase